MLRSQACRNALRLPAALALCALLPPSLAATTCPDVLPPLPADIEAARDEVVELAFANLENWGDPTIQALLEEQVAILAPWFADNRPANELELTRQSWLGIWYEDPSIIPDIPGFLSTDRENTFQVVRDGYYYNLARVEIFGIPGIDVVTNFLKGEYQIIDEAGPETCGEIRRNVVDLEFAGSTLVTGWVPPERDLVEVVELFDAGSYPGVPLEVTGTGELWNVFIDDEVRISYGRDDDPEAGGDGLFVLVRQDFVTE